VTVALGSVGALPSMPAPMGPIGATDDVQSGASAGGGGFADMLSSAVSGLNGQLTSSEKMSEDAATGGLTDPTEALVAVEKADLAFSTAVQVRNKLVEGWQELSRMQV